MMANSPTNSTSDDSSKRKNDRYRNDSLPLARVDERGF